MLQLLFRDKYITQIKFNQKELQLCDDNINIGSETRAFLLLHEDEIAPAIVQRFFKTVRSFCTEVVNKMQELSTEAVVRIARALQQLHIEDLDKLKDEFLEYQFEEEKNLPNFESIDQFCGSLSTTSGKFQNIREETQKVRYYTAGVCNWRYGAQCSASLCFEAPRHVFLAPSCKRGRARCHTRPCGREKLGLKLCARIANTRLA